MIIVDSHAHLNDEQFDEDRGGLIASLSDKGIRAVIECAAEPGDLDAAADLARRYQPVYAAVGVHPHSASEYTDEVEEHIKALCQEKKVVAIGEIGLDYHYDFSPRAVQKQVLRRQIALAREIGLPVILHSRESTADMLAILTEYREIKGVMHCFSGSVETMRTLLRLGMYIGFGGSLTFKNNMKTVAAAREVPLNRMLVETDSPYMAPVPMRGKRNQPAYTRYVVQKLAEIKNLQEEEVARMTTENADALFHLFRTE